VDPRLRFVTLVVRVADPDGFRWEIAWNPGPFGQSVL